MKITIDTDKDSKEDIRKAISFLSSLSAEGSVAVEESEPQPFVNMFGSSEEAKEEINSQEVPAQTDNMFSMFGNDNSSSQEASCESTQVSSNSVSDISQMSQMLSEQSSSQTEVEDKPFDDPLKALLEIVIKFFVHIIGNL